MATLTPCSSRMAASFLARVLNADHDLQASTATVVVGAFVFFEGEAAASVVPTPLSLFFRRTSGMIATHKPACCVLLPSYSPLPSRAMLRRAFSNKRRLPYFFVHVMSDGSSVPSLYGAPLPGSPEKMWRVTKHDWYTHPLWQKADSKHVSNEDEEAAEAFKKKFFK